jgi:type II secretory pathway pseudopilin PulG
VIAFRSPTLVEFILTIIILGALAAILTPQLAQALAEHREATLAADLATIRQAIERYRIQHDGRMPDERIVNQLTEQTNWFGERGNEFSAAYGPYLNGDLPRNAIDASRSITFVPVMVVNPPPDARGWVYATRNGEFRAYAPGVGPSGTHYFDL